MAYSNVVPKMRRCGEARQEGRAGDLRIGVDDHLLVSNTTSDTFQRGCDQRVAALTAKTSTEDLALGD
jgi:hypothetical protein